MPYDPYEYREFARGDMALYGLSSDRHRYVRVISRCLSIDGQNHSYVVNDGEQTFCCTWMHLTPILPLPAAAEERS